MEQDLEKEEKEKRAKKEEKERKGFLAAGLNARRCFVLQQNQLRIYAKLCVALDALH